MGRILTGLLMLVANVACGQQMICEGGVCRLQPVRGIVRMLGSIGPDVVIRNNVTFSPTIVEQAPVVVQAPVVQCPQPISIVETARTQSSSSTRIGSHWSYPGDIYSHLQREHGVNTSGMSREQAMALHDRLHEQQRGRTIRRPLLRLWNR